MSNKIISYKDFSKKYDISIRTLKAKFEECVFSVGKEHFVDEERFLKELPSRSKSKSRKSSSTLSPGILNRKAEQKARMAIRVSGEIASFRKERIIYADDFKAKVLDQKIKSHEALLKNIKKEQEALESQRDELFGLEG
jgi:hypothetical protein